MINGAPINAATILQPVAPVYFLELVGTDILLFPSPLAVDVTACRGEAIISPARALITSRSGPTPASRLTSSRSNKLC